MATLTFTNGFGDIRAYPIVAEFKDDEGAIHYVVGPVPRGNYDYSPPFDVIRFDEEQHIWGD